MFGELFTKTFYGNTVVEWATAIGIIIGFVVAGKAVYWFLKKIVQRITAQTTSRLDDILLDMLEEPLVFALVLSGIWYSLTTLKLHREILDWIHKSYYILIIGNVTWFIARLSDALIEEYVVPWAMRTKSDFDDHLVPLLKKSINVGIWIVALIVAADNAGYDLKTLVAGLGIGGLAFALAAKETLANFIAGVTIIADRPFAANHWILVKGFRAKVEDVGMRSTRFRTDKGSIVIIPNSDLVNTIIENYSLGPGIVEETVIPFAYEMSELQLAHAFDLMREAVRNCPKVADVCSISFDTLTDTAVLVRFRYYVNPLEPHAASRTELFLNIYQKFREHNVKLARPVRRIEMANETEISFPKFMMGQ